MTRALRGRGLRGAFLLKSAPFLRASPPASANDQ